MLKGLVDILAAMLTPIIGALAAWIAYMQWVTNDRRRKSEYFHLRITAYDAIESYLGHLLAHGSVQKDAEMSFLHETRHVLFLFGSDIKSFVDEVFDKSTRLHALDREQGRLAGAARGDNLDRQQKIKDWFQSQHRGLQDRFNKHLKL